MQTPGRAALAPSNSVYTDTQVLDQLLRSGIARERWRYELLAADFTPKGDITSDVTLDTSNILTVNTSQDVQRTMALTTLGNPLDALSDLIRPHYQIEMPDGGWCDFILGVFNCLPNGETVTLAYTTATLACADSGQLLSDSGIQYATGIGAGTNYIQAITSVAESYGGGTPIPVMIPDIGKKLPAAITWSAGTSRISIINDLLSAMNYYPAWFDERGSMRSSPIPDYRTVNATAAFNTVTDSIIYQQMTTQPDFGNVYNQFLLTVSNPATSVSNGTAAATGTSTGTGQGFSMYYENDDPLSPISLKRWHPKLYSWSDSSVSDKATAHDMCVTQAQLSERVYSPITFQTPAWPLSQSNDIYTMNIVAADRPQTNYTYIETGWSMTMYTGNPTTHTFEQISFNASETSFT